MVFEAPMSKSAQQHRHSSFGTANSTQQHHVLPTQKRRGRKPGLNSTVAQRSAANARERSRMRVLSTAFVELKGALPWVPKDTKLSKLDTLKLAAGYISYLRRILDTSSNTIDQHDETGRLLMASLSSGQGAIDDRPDWRLLADASSQSSDYHDCQDQGDVEEGIGRVLNDRTTPQNHIEPSNSSELTTPVNDTSNELPQFGLTTNNCDLDVIDFHQHRSPINNSIHSNRIEAAHVPMPPVPSAIIPSDSSQLQPLLGNGGEVGDRVSDDGSGRLLCSTNGSTDSLNFLDQYKLHPTPNMQQGDTTCQVSTTSSNIEWLNSSCASSELFKHDVDRFLTPHTDPTNSTISRPNEQEGYKFNELCRPVDIQQPHVPPSSCFQPSQLFESPNNSCYPPIDQGHVNSSWLSNSSFLLPNSQQPSFLSNYPPPPRYPSGSVGMVDLMVPTGTSLH